MEVTVGRVCNIHFVVSPSPLDTSPTPFPAPANVSPRRFVVPETPLPTVLVAVPRVLPGDVRDVHGYG
jgi:hypothetical protein